MSFFVLNPSSKGVINLVIGRFQPLHNSHVHLIQSAINSGPTLVLVGCSESDGSSEKNPFTYEERKKLITDTLDCSVKPLFDTTDELWLQQIKDITEGYSQVVVFVCDKDRSTINSNSLIGTKFPLVKVPIKDNQVSGTSIRALLKHGIISKDVPLVTKNFLMEKLNIG